MNIKIMLIMAALFTTGIFNLYPKDVRALATTLGVNPSEMLSEWNDRFRDIKDIQGLYDRQRRFNIKHFDAESFVKGLLSDYDMILAKKGNDAETTKVHRFFRTVFEQRETYHPEPQAAADAGPVTTAGQAAFLRGLQSSESGQFEEDGRQKSCSGQVDAEEGGDAMEEGGGGAEISSQETEGRKEGSSKQHHLENEGKNTATQTATCERDSQAGSARRKKGGAFGKASVFFMYTPQQSMPFLNHLNSS
jgi:hypothetical protein